MLRFETFNVEKRISLSINGLHRRHINHPKSDYRGIERIVAYQFDSTILRDCDISCIFLLFVEFDSNKEDVVSPIFSLGAYKPFRGD